METEGHMQTIINLILLVIAIAYGIKEIVTHKNNTKE